MFEIRSSIIAYVMKCVRLRLEDNVDMSIDETQYACSDMYMKLVYRCT